MNTLISEIREDGKAFKRLLLQLPLFLGLLIAMDMTIDGVLRAGLVRYFEFEKEADVVCVGHSRTEMGISPKALGQGTGLAVTRYAMSGVSLSDREVMTRQYLAEHPATKILLYDVESTSFTSRNLSVRSYTLFYPFIGNPDVRKYLAEQSGILERMPRYALRSSRYSGSTTAFSVSGWLDNREFPSHRKADVAAVQRRIKSGKVRPVEVDPDLLQTFKRTIAYARDTGVVVILWHPPTLGVLDDHQHQQREEVRLIFSELAANDKGVFYVDLSSEFKDRPELLSDAIHVNSEGRKAITKILSDRICAISKGLP